MMNERIKELAEQAIAKSAADNRVGTMEYFAELIVRECADLFEIEWGEEKLTGNDVGYVLKKHFGVE